MSAYFRNFCLLFLLGIILGDILDVAASFPSNTSSRTFSESPSSEVTLTQSKSATSTVSKTSSFSPTSTGSKTVAMTPSDLSFSLSSTTTLSQSLTGNSVSISPSASTTRSFSTSLTPTITPPATPTSSRSISASISLTTTDSEILSPSVSLSRSVSVSQTPSSSMSFSVTSTITPPDTMTPSRSFSSSFSSSESISGYSRSSTDSPSITDTITPPFTPTKSESISVSLSISHSMTLSDTVTPPPTATPTDSRTSTDSITPPPTLTPTRSRNSVSFSFSASPSPSLSNSKSVTSTPSVSKSQTPSSSTSLSETFTPPATLTPSKSFSVSISISQSATGSTSFSKSASVSQSVSNTLSRSFSQTISLSKTSTATATTSHTSTPSVSESFTTTRTASGSSSPPITQSKSLSFTVTETATLSASLTGPTHSFTSELTLSVTMSLTSSGTFSNEETMTETAIVTATKNTDTLSETFSLSASLDTSISHTVTPSKEIILPFEKNLAFEFMIYDEMRKPVSVQYAVLRSEQEILAERRIIDEYLNTVKMALREIIFQAAKDAHLKLFVLPNASRSDDNGRTFWVITIAFENISPQSEKFLGVKMFLLSSPIPRALLTWNVVSIRGIADPFVSPTFVLIMPKEDTISSDGGAYLLCGDNFLLSMSHRTDLQVARWGYSLAHPTVKIVRTTPLTDMTGYTSFYISSVPVGVDIELTFTSRYFQFAERKSIRIRRTNLLVLKPQLPTRVEHGRDSVFSKTIPSSSSNRWYSVAINEAAVVINISQFLSSIKERDGNGSVVGIDDLLRRSYHLGASLRVGDAHVSTLRETEDVVVLVRGTESQYVEIYASHLQCVRRAFKVQLEVILPPSTSLLAGQGLSETECNTSFLVTASSNIAVEECSGRGKCTKGGAKCNCFDSALLGHWNQPKRQTIRGVQYAVPCGACQLGYSEASGCKAFSECRRYCRQGSCIQSAVTSQEYCQCFQDPARGYWAGTYCQQCDPQHQGRNCSVCLPDMYDSPVGSCSIYCSDAVTCNHHGKCTISREGIARCECFASSSSGYWAGEHCDQCQEPYLLPLVHRTASSVETPLIIIRQCAVQCDENVHCSGHGVCTSSQRLFRQQTEGLFKDMCQCFSTASLGYFETNASKASSTYAINGTLRLCDQCIAGFNGTNCQHPVHGVCNDSSTCHHGDCVGHVCVCHQNASHGYWQGVLCGQCRVDPNVGFYDFSSNCTQCQQGFWGPKCKNPCQCSSHGSCLAINGSCLCHGDIHRGYWSGKACDRCQLSYFPSPSYSLLPSVPLACTVRCDVDSCNYGVCAQVDGRCQCFANATHGFFEGNDCTKCSSMRSSVSGNVSFETGFFAYQYHAFETIPPIGAASSPQKDSSLACEHCQLTFNGSECRQSSFGCGESMELLGSQFSGQVLAMPDCAGHGICTVNGVAQGLRQCSCTASSLPTGFWTGANCDACEPGFTGPMCNQRVLRTQDLVQCSKITSFATLTRFVMDNIFSSVNVIFSADVVTAVPGADDHCSNYFDYKSSFLFGPEARCQWISSRVLKVQLDLQYQILHWRHYMQEEKQLQSKVGRHVQLSYSLLRDKDYLEIGSMLTFRDGIVADAQCPSYLVPGKTLSLSLPFHYDATGGNLALRGNNLVNHAVIQGEQRVGVCEAIILDGLSGSQILSLRMEFIFTLVDVLLPDAAALTEQQRAMLAGVSADLTQFLALYRFDPILRIPLVLTPSGLQYRFTLTLLDAFSGLHDVSKLFTIEKSDQPELSLRWLRRPPPTIFYSRQMAFIAEVFYPSTSCLPSNSTVSMKEDAVKFVWQTLPRSLIVAPSSKLATVSTILTQFFVIPSLRVPSFTTATVSVSASTSGNATELHVPALLQASVQMLPSPLIAEIVGGSHLYVQSNTDLSIECNCYDPDEVTDEAETIQWTCVKTAATICPGAISTALLQSRGRRVNLAGSLPIGYRSDSVSGNPLNGRGDNSVPLLLAVEYRKGSRRVNAFVEIVVDDKLHALSSGSILRIAATPAATIFTPLSPQQRLLLEATKQKSLENTTTRVTEMYFWSCDAQLDLEDRNHFPMGRRSRMFVIEANTLFPGMIVRCHVQLTREGVNGNSSQATSAGVTIFVNSCPYGGQLLAEPHVIMLEKLNQIQGEFVELRSVDFLPYADGEAELFSPFPTDSSSYLNSSLLNTSVPPPSVSLEYHYTRLDDNGKEHDLSFGWISSPTIRIPILSLIPVSWPSYVSVTLKVAARVIIVGTESHTQRINNVQHLCQRIAASTMLIGLPTQGEEFIPLNAILQLYNSGNILHLLHATPHYLWGHMSTLSNVAQNINHVLHLVNHSLVIWTSDRVAGRSQLDNSDDVEVMITVASVGMQLLHPASGTEKWCALNPDLTLSIIQSLTLLFTEIAGRRLDNLESPSHFTSYQLHSTFAAISGYYSCATAALGKYRRRQLNTTRREFHEDAAILQTIALSEQVAREVLKNSYHLERKQVASTMHELSCVVVQAQEVTASTTFNVELMDPSAFLAVPSVQINASSISRLVGVEKAGYCATLLKPQFVLLSLIQLPSGVVIQLPEAILMISVFNLYDRAVVNLAATGSAIHRKDAVCVNVSVPFPTITKEPKAPPQCLFLEIESPGRIFPSASSGSVCGLATTQLVRSGLLIKCSCCLTTGRRGIIVPMLQQTIDVLGLEPFFATPADSGLDVTDPPSAAPNFITARRMWKDFNSSLGIDTHYGWIFILAVIALAVFCCFIGSSIQRALQISFYQSEAVEAQRNHPYLYSSVWKVLKALTQYNVWWWMCFPGAILSHRRLHQECSVFFILIFWSILLVGAIAVHTTTWHMSSLIRLNSSLSLLEDGGSDSSFCHHSTLDISRPSFLNMTSSQRASNIFATFGSGGVVLIAFIVSLFTPVFWFIYHSMYLQPLMTTVLQSLQSLRVEAQYAVHGVEKDLSRISMFHALSKYQHLLLDLVQRAVQMRQFPSSSDTYFAQSAQEIEKDDFLSVPNSPINQDDFIDVEVNPEDVMLVSQDAVSTAPSWVVCFENISRDFIVNQGDYLAAVTIRFLIELQQHPHYGHANHANEKERFALYNNAFVKGIRQIFEEQNGRKWSKDIVEGPDFFSLFMDNTMATSDTINQCGTTPHQVVARLSEALQCQGRNLETDWLYLAKDLCHVSMKVQFPDKHFLQMLAALCFELHFIDLYPDIAPLLFSPVHSLLSTEMSDQGNTSILDSVMHHFNNVDHVQHSSLQALEGLCHQLIQRYTWAVPTKNQQESSVPLCVGWCWVWYYSTCHLQANDMMSMVDLLSPPVRGGEVKRFTSSQYHAVGKEQNSHLVTAPLLMLITLPSVRFDAGTALLDAISEHLLKLDRCPTEEKDGAAMSFSFPHSLAMVDVLLTLLMKSCQNALTLNEYTTLPVDVQLIVLWSSAVDILQWIPLQEIRSHLSGENTTLLDVVRYMRRDEALYRWDYRPSTPTTDRPPVSPQTNRQTSRVLASVVALFCQSELERKMPPNYAQDWGALSKCLLFLRQMEVHSGIELLVENSLFLSAVAGLEGAQASPGVTNQLQCPLLRCFVNFLVDLQLRQHFESHDREDPTVLMPQIYTSDRSIHSRFTNVYAASSTILSSGSFMHSLSLLQAIIQSSPTKHQLSRKAVGSGSLLNPWRSFSQACQLLNEKWDSEAEVPLEDTTSPRFEPSPVEAIRSQQFEQNTKGKEPTRLLLFVFPGVYPPLQLKDIRGVSIVPVMSIFPSHFFAPDRAIIIQPTFHTPIHRLRESLGSLSRSFRRPVDIASVPLLSSEVDKCYYPCERSLALLTLMRCHQVAIIGIDFIVPMNAIAKPRFASSFAEGDHTSRSLYGRPFFSCFASRSSSCVVAQCSFSLEIRQRGAQGGQLLSCTKFVPFYSDEMNIVVGRRSKAASSGVRFNIANSTLLLPQLSFNNRYAIYVRYGVWLNNFEFEQIETMLKSQMHRQRSAVNFYPSVVVQNREGHQMKALPGDDNESHVIEQEQEEGREQGSVASISSDSAGNETADLQDVIRQVSRIEMTERLIRRRHIIHYVVWICHALLWGAAALLVVSQGDDDPNRVVDCNAHGVSRRALLTLRSPTDLGSWILLSTYTLMWQWIFHCSFSILVTICRGILRKPLAD